MMEARKVDIYIDKVKAHSFERAEGNEIEEVAVVVDDKRWTIIH